MTIYSSNQDFATGIAKSYGVLLDCAGADERIANDYEAKFADALHQAMGYRREHADELTF